VGGAILANKIKVTNRQQLNKLKNKHFGKKFAIFGGFVQRDYVTCQITTQRKQDHYCEEAVKAIVRIVGLYGEYGHVIF